MRTTEVESWPVSEVAGWLAYSELEPFSVERADWNAAHICQTIARANGAKNVTVKDFLLRWNTSDAQPEQTDEEARRVFEKVASVINAGK